MLAVLFARSASAHVLHVGTANGSFAAAVALAGAGDTLVLAGGIHRGPFVVDRSITLRGDRGAILDGGGQGSVIQVIAAGATVEDIEVRGSGKRVITIDAGVRVLNAPGVTVRHVHVHDVLYGVYVERSDRIAVEDCTLSGRVAAGRDDGEGNGIHLWFTRDARLTHNDLRGFEDAIYLSFADSARAYGNRLRDNGRYGFHTMYCQSSALIANVFTHNSAGCAIMFSNHLAVSQNRFIHNRGPRTYGLLLRDCSDGAFEDNQVVDNTIGFFLDNSNRNNIRGNLVEDNGWGVLLFSSCAGNEFSRNSFIQNDYPIALDMKYTNNRFDDGHAGNYWSENAGYDLNGDGISDAAYSPVGTFAFLSKQYPDLAVLAKSPAVAALSVAEQVVPALRPSEAVDRFPLISPPHGSAAGVVTFELEREARRSRNRSRLGLAAFGSLAAASLAVFGAARRSS